MTIERINTNLTTSEKIRLLNEMIMELNGKIDQAKFDKNELDSVYDDGITARKFLRNQSLGHTLSTYTGWTHLHAETGYSIWKYTPTTYAYNALNQLYLDNELLEFKGAGSAESVTAFDHVLLYDDDLSGGGGYLNHTTEAGTEEGTEFFTIEETSDYLYIGSSDATFTGVKFEFQNRGSGLTLKVEYFNAGAGDGWEPMTANANDLSDTTSNFESDGIVSWTAPNDWTKCGVDAKVAYWVRISTTTTAITVPEAYYIVPNASVIGLLALSSEEITDATWKWCSYGTSIYVTIRNSGASQHEGDYFITSASSATNKQNYFIYNHSFLADYQNSTF